MVTATEQKVIPGVIAAPGTASVDIDMAERMIPGVVSAPGQASVTSLPALSSPGIAGIIGVSQTDRSDLTEEEKAKLAELGPEGFNVWYKEKFETEHVQVGEEDGDEWVEKEQFDALSEEQREALKEHGVEGYQDWFTDNYESVGDDEWIEKSKFEEMEEEQREALKEQGFEGYQTWFGENYEQIGPDVEGEERSWVKKGWIEENLPEALTDVEGNEINPQILFRKGGQEAYDVWAKENLVDIGTEFGEDEVDEEGNLYRSQMSKYELLQMDPEARKITVERGLEGYGRWFDANHTEVGVEGSEEFVPNTQLEEMGEEDREVLLELGNEGYREWVEENYEIVTPGEGPGAGEEAWMDKETFDSLEPEGQEAFRIGGQEGYQTWFGDTYVEVGTGFGAEDVDDKGEEYRGFISHETFDDMTPEYQEAVKHGGMQAYWTKFNEEHTVVGPPPAEGEEQEYATNEFIEELEEADPDGAEAYRTGGEEGYDQWYDSTYTEVGTPEGMAEALRQDALLNFVEPAKSEVQVMPEIPEITTGIDFSKLENQQNYVRVGTGAEGPAQYMMRGEYQNLVSQNPEVAEWVSRGGKGWRENMGSRYMAVAGGSLYMPREFYQKLKFRNHQLASMLVSRGPDGLEQWVTDEWEIPKDDIEANVVTREWLDGLSTEDRAAVESGGIIATELAYKQIQPEDGSEEIWVLHGEYDNLEEGRKEALQYGGLAAAQEWEEANYKTLGYTDEDGNSMTIAMADWAALETQVTDGEITQEDLDLYVSEGPEAMEKAIASRNWEVFVDEHRLVNVTYKDPATGMPPKALGPDGPDSPMIPGAIWVKKDEWDKMSHGERAELSATGGATGTITVENRSGDPIEVSRWEWNQKDTKAKLFALGWPQPDSARYVSFAIAEKAQAGDDRYMDPEMMKLSRTHGFHGTIRQHDKPKWKWRGTEGYWEYYTIDLPDGEKDRYDAWKKEWNNLRDQEYKNYGSDYGKLAAVGEVINDMVGFVLPAIRVAKPGVDFKEISGMEWFMTGAGAATMFIPAAAGARMARIAAATKTGTTTAKMPFYARKLGTWRGIATGGLKAPMIVGKISVKASKAVRPVAKVVAKAPAPIPRVVVKPSLMGKAAGVRPLSIGDVASAMGTKVVKPMAIRVGKMQTGFDRVGVGKAGYYAKPITVADTLKGIGSTAKVGYKAVHKSQLGTRALKAGKRAGQRIEDVEIRSGKVRMPSGAQGVNPVRRLTMGQAGRRAYGFVHKSDYGTRITDQTRRQLVTQPLRRVKQIKTPIKKGSTQDLMWDPQKGLVGKVWQPRMTLGEVGGALKTGTQKVVYGTQKAGAFDLERLPGMARRGAMRKTARHRAGIKQQALDMPIGPKGHYGHSVTVGEGIEGGRKVGHSMTHPWRRGTAMVAKADKATVGRVTGKLEDAQMYLKKPKMSKVGTARKRPIQQRPTVPRHRSKSSKPQDPVTFDQIGTRIVERPLRPPKSVGDDWDELLKPTQSGKPGKPFKQAVSKTDDQLLSDQMLREQLDARVKSVQRIKDTPTPKQQFEEMMRRSGVTDTDDVADIVQRQRALARPQPSGKPFKQAVSKTDDQLLSDQMLREQLDARTREMRRFKDQPTPKQQFEEMMRDTGYRETGGSLHQAPSRYKPSSAPKVTSEPVRQLAKVADDVPAKSLRPVMEMERPTTELVLEPVYSVKIAKPIKVHPGRAKHIRRVKAQTSQQQRQSQVQQLKASRKRVQAPLDVPGSPGAKFGMGRPVGASRFAFLGADAPSPVRAVGIAPGRGVDPTGYPRTAPSPLGTPIEAPMISPIRLPEGAEEMEPLRLAADLPEETPEAVISAVDEPTEEPVIEPEPERVPEPTPEPAPAPAALLFDDVYARPPTEIRVPKTPRSRMKERRTGLKPKKVVPFGGWLPDADAAEEKKKKKKLGRKRRAALETLPVKEGALMLYLPKLASVETKIEDPLNPRALEVWQTRVLRKETTRTQTRMGAERKAKGKGKGRKPSELKRVKVNAKR